MMIKLIVNVTKILKKKNEYCKFKFEVTEDNKYYNSTKIAFGQIDDVYVGDTVEILGEEVVIKNRRLLKVITYSLLRDAETNEIEKYLLRLSKKLNIKAKSIKDLVEKHGKLSQDIILNDLDEASKFIENTTKIKRLRDSINGFTGFNKVKEYFESRGIKYDSYLEIYNKYGIGSIQMAKNEPYSLYKVLSFNEMDNLAEHNGFKYNSRMRIREALINTILETMNYTGEIFVDISKENLNNATRNYLIRSGAFIGCPELADDEISGMLQILKEKGVLVSNSNYEEDILFIYKYWDLQNKVAIRIDTHVKDNSYTNGYIKIGQNDIRKYLLNTTINYNDKQLEAISGALNSKLTIITGGPGTGKTQVIRGIVQSYENRFKEINPFKSPIIKTCAPTGKAAKRVEELTGNKAMTIHRMIGIRDFERGFKDLDSIDAELIIVDEASMLDGSLFCDLINSIKPYTHLVLVGDQNQLPCIGKWNIFNDLIEIAKTEGLDYIQYCELNEVYRQNKGSSIVTNAYKVLHNETSNDLDFELNEEFRIHNTNDIFVTKYLVLKAIEEHIKLGFSIDKLQILTLSNEGLLGVKELNRDIQAFLSRVNKEAIRDINKLEKFTIGEKVMQTRNNYSLGVFNGEVGIIKSKINNDKLTVDYGDKYVEYDRDNINEIELAYVITVHKSQGSEFEKVILIADDNKFMMEKSLLYTAITRAVREFSFIGEANLLKEAVGKDRKNIERTNYLKKMLMVEKGLLF